jgi:hypothetical protein
MRRCFESFLMPGRALEGLFTENGYGNSCLSIGKRVSSHRGNDGISSVIAPFSRVSGK